MVAELLGNRQARESHAQTCARRLVHLTEDKCCLRVLEVLDVDVGEVPFAALHAFFELLAIFHNTALDHLAEEVVALTGTLAHTGEHREAVVALGDVVDELHD